VSPPAAVAARTRELDDLLDELVGSPSDSRSFTTQTASHAVGAAPATTPPRTRAPPVPAAAAGGGGRPARGATDPTAIIANIGDLQRAGAAQLAMAKAKMDVVFEAHVLKPGDPGYIFDKRVEFAPSTEPSAWDD